MTWARFMYAGMDYTSASQFLSLTIDGLNLRMDERGGIIDCTHCGRASAGNFARRHSRCVGLRVGS